MKLLKILLLFNVLFFLHAHAKNAELAVEKTANTAQVGYNGTIIYTIAITNTGDDNAVDVNVTDNLPSGLTNVTVTDPGSFTNCAPSGSTVTCTGGSVAKGGKTDAIVITANAPSTEGVITNTATVSGGGTNAVIINKNTSVNILVMDLSGTCHTNAIDFFTIDDSYDDNATFIGQSTSGSNEEVYLKVTAITNPNGADINGTLLSNIYSPSWDNLTSIQLLDRNCNVLQDYSGNQQISFTQWLNSAGVWYIHVDSSQSQYVVASLFYPDANASSNVGGGGQVTSTEPAIYRAYEEADDLSTLNDPYIQTKIVNDAFNVKVAAVNADTLTLLTSYSAFFRLQLIDGDQTCQGTLPYLKDYSLFGIKNNQGYELVEDLLYEKADKNVKLRMQYLADPSDGGVIDYNDLVQTQICLNNTQNCLWGVLTNLESTKNDPFLPDFSIADLCGIYCDPGGGTGNNQVTQACADCVFGLGYSDCSDNFAIRPDKFDVNITSGDLFIAEKETSLAFKALDGATTTAPTLDYNETQNISFYIDLNVSDNSGCEIKSLTITPSVSFTDGEHNDNFTFDDIGDINMSIHETNGTEFAIIDADDTPFDDRLIQEYNATFTVIPDHFNIDANLSDHNDVSNFTYLHDINQYDSDDNYSMGSVLTVDIKAMGADDNLPMRNYIKGCYAKDTNITLAIVDTNITYPGDQPLDYFLYFNPEEYNSSIPNSGEGNETLPAPVGKTITITSTSLPIKNFASSFPAQVAPDVNGTTHIKYKLNFDRKLNLVVNPFKIILNNVDINDTDDVNGTTGALSNQNATMYYARTRASKFFYDDVNDSSKDTPIAVDVYCDFNDFDECRDMGIKTYTGAQTNEAYWWLSLGHRENSTQHDGNVTLLVDTANIKPLGATATVTPTNVQITSGGLNTNVTVTATSAERPMTVPIELVNRIDLSTPSVSPYTNTWLIYNEYSATEVPSPFYKVHFIGVSEWAGHGDTGNVVDSDTSTKKNRRLGW